MARAVARHKTAITRTEPSRPIKLALADRLLGTGGQLFDFGCGRGDDLRLLAARGVAGSGWDPVHRPNAPVAPAPIVNLGYVVNVIEDAAERRGTLQHAWSLTGTVLIVSARLAAEARELSGATDLGDGYLTGLGTFQKFYTQDELKTWVEATLEARAVPAGPGVFYVFRHEEDRVAFVASRYRRQVAVPRASRAEALFAEHQESLRPLIEFVTHRGRLPEADELPESDEVGRVFGSPRRAFRVVEKATGAAPWEAVRSARSQDLLIYLALARFDGRPQLSRLPLVLQRDVRGLFGSYSHACSEADHLLFSVGQPDVVDAACGSSRIGKVMPTALYVHASALEELSPPLRVLEGCARGYIGRVEGATVIKLHRHEPKVSYLAYPSFFDDPHPALAWSLRVNLKTFDVRFRDFVKLRNPPILHRKEAFLGAEHPRYLAFQRLTRSEERHGLYQEPSKIGTREGWNDVLRRTGLELHRHRLIKVSTARTAP